MTQEIDSYKKQLNEIEKRERANQNKETAIDKNDGSL